MVANVHLVGTIANTGPSDRFVEDFLGFLAARRPDPATGGPDMAAIGAWLEAHPETLPAVQFAVADMEIMIATARALTFAVAEEWQRGEHHDAQGMTRVLQPKYFATPNAIETARSLVPETRRTTGRAIAMRRTKRPIAAITETKAIARAVTKLGVAAVSEVDGTGNCGNGPGFGPTAKVNALRTGCPSTEITRQ